MTLQMTLQKIHRHGGDKINGGSKPFFVTLPIGFETPIQGKIVTWRYIKFGHLVI